MSGGSRRKEVGGWVGGWLGGCLPQVLNDDIAARVPVVRVLVRVRHAVPAVVGAEGAAVVGEVHAVVGSAVVDLGE